MLKRNEVNNYFEMTNNRSFSPLTDRKDDIQHLTC